MLALAILVTWQLLEHFANKAQDVSKDRGGIVAHQGLPDVLPAADILDKVLYGAEVPCQLAAACSQPGAASLAG